HYLVFIDLRCICYSSQILIQEMCVFSVNYNPFRRTDSCVHQNTASCALRHSKLKLVPQNYLLLQRAEKTSEVSFLCEFKMGIVIEQFANRMKKKKIRLQ